MSRVDLTTIAPSGHKPTHVFKTRIVGVDWLAEGLNMTKNEYQYAFWGTHKTFNIILIPNINTFIFLG